MRNNIQKVKSAGSFRIFSVLLVFFTVSGSLEAEIIDRIMAVVNGKIITLSDVRKERAVASAFGDAAEASKDDAAILQDLVERLLVEGEISQFPDIEVTDAEVDAALRDVSPGTGVPQSDVRDALKRRILRARYFDYRFRQFIRAEDEDIQKYYDDVFVPEARSRGLNPIPTLAAAADSIRNNVIDEKMSQEVESWLETIRRRSDVEIFK